MGRTPWTTRLTVEECLSLDICVFKTLFRQNRIVVGTYRWHDNSRANCATLNYRVIPDSCSGPALCDWLHGGDKWKLCRILCLHYNNSMHFWPAASLVLCAPWFEMDLCAESGLGNCFCHLVQNILAADTVITSLTKVAKPTISALIVCPAPSRRIEHRALSRRSEMRFITFPDGSDLAPSTGKESTEESGHTSTNYRGHLALVPEAAVRC